MTTTRLVTITLAALGLMPAAAEAACNISTTAVNFGTYNVFAATPDDATGRVRFRCNGSSPPSVTIHLDKGGSASFNPRQLRQGTEVLGYNLYLDSTRTTIWSVPGIGIELISRASISSRLRPTSFLRPPARATEPSLPCAPPK